MTASNQVSLAGARWRKSSYSNCGNQCVEVAQAGDIIAVRDSKNPGAGYLTFTTAEWETFLTSIKNQSQGK
jgi:hypothetical protein